MALGELERAVMAQLWSAPTPLTVREVHDRLERELAYTTVMTVLGRLAKKGVVAQERDGKAYRYAATASREQMAAALMLDALGEVGEERTATLVAFADQVGPEEAATLRAALDGSSVRPRRTITTEVTAEVAPEVPEPRGGSDREVPPES